MDERNPANEDPGIDDLDASEDEAEAVTGGRMTAGDPCDGGE